MKRPVFLLLVVALAVAGCAPPQTADLEAQRVAVKSVVDDFATVLETKDMDLFAGIMAHDSDMVAFGTDASERWVGYDAIRAAVQAQLTAFDAVALTVRDQVIHVHPSGLVAWVSEVTDWQITQDENQVDLPGVRLTGVLEMRDGSWVFVQFHVSVPVEGQAAAY